MIRFFNTIIKLLSLTQEIVKESGKLQKMGEELKKAKLKSSSSGEPQFTKELGINGLDKQITHFSCTADNIDISLANGPSPEYTFFSESKISKDDLIISENLQGHTLTLSIQYKLNNNPACIKVLLPSTIGIVDLQTENGDIHAANAKLINLNAKTVNGDISLKECAFSNAALISNCGDIKVNMAMVDTTSQVTVLDTKTNTGDITIKDCGLSCNYSLETNCGEIDKGKLQFNPNSRFKLLCRTQVGDIKIKN